MMKLIVLLAFVALTCANYGSTAETNAPAEASVIVSEVPPATCEGEAVRSCAKKCKAHCNNGVGNGPDCRPGRARYSNDDHGGVPGSPGARGGGAAGTKYTTSEKGNNNIENGDLAFLGSLDGVFKKSKCHDDCEDAEFAKCKAPVASLPPATAAPQECVLPVGGNEKDCEKRSFDFCGPEVTSAFTTCRQVFTKFCVKPEPVTDAESCLRARCDTLPKDQWHSAAEKSAACRKGDGRGGVSQQCQEQICQKYTTKAPETTTKAVVYTTKGASVGTTTKARETTTKARETTTKATTTKAPETTTKAPETTTKAPETTTKAPETTTKAPETTTKAPETVEPCVTERTTVKLAGGSCKKSGALRKQIEDLNCVIKSMLEALEGPKYAVPSKAQSIKKKVEVEVAVKQAKKAESVAEKAKAVYVQAKTEVKKAEEAVKNVAAPYKAEAEKKVKVAIEKAKSKSRKAKSLSKKAKVAEKKVEEKKAEYKKVADARLPKPQRRRAARTTQARAQQPRAARTTQARAQQPRAARTTQARAQQPRASRTTQQPRAQQPRASRTTQQARAQQPRASRTTQQARAQQPRASRTTQQPRAQPRASGY